MTYPERRKAAWRAAAAERLAAFLFEHPRCVMCPAPMVAIRRSLTCSRACCVRRWNTLMRERRVVRPTRTCAWVTCSEKVDPMMRRTTRYCSARCNQRAWRRANKGWAKMPRPGRECRRCKGLISSTKRQGTVFCSKPCNDAYPRARLAA